MLYITGIMAHLLPINGNNYFSYNDNIVKWVAGDDITVVTLKAGAKPTYVTYDAADEYLGSLVTKVYCVGDSITEGVGAANKVTTAYRNNLPGDSRTTR